MPGFKPKFKKPSVVIPAQTSKDQRWYVKFYCYDSGKGRVCRHRFYLPGGKSTEENRKLARRMMRHINQYLKLGYYIDRSKWQVPDHIKRSKEIIPEKDPTNICIIDSLESSLERKRSTTEKNYVNYKLCLRHFYEYLNKQDLTRIRATEFNKAMANDFLADLAVSTDYHPRGKVYTQRTIDNHLIVLKALFNVSLEREEVEKNPFSGISPKDRAVGRHVAYKEDEIRMILNFCKSNGLEQVAFACMFMMYTLARPSEMSRLAIGDIDRYVEGKIYLAKEKSKNRFERQISIHPTLAPEIRDLKQLPSDWYIFSRAMKPGMHYNDYANMGKYFRDRVLNPLGFDKEHTFYSWKHTGVVLAHKNGVPDYYIMLQGGWRSYPAFARYLKSCRYPI